LSTPTVGEVERFRDAVTARLGLALDDARLGVLADLLARRLRSTGSTPAGYLGSLEAGVGSAELGALAQELTVPETYFFRHVAQFEAFAEVALPDRIRAGSARRSLRVLSAGCASGEEAYSLAIYLRDAGLDGTWDVSVRAVDVSPAALHRARAGRYSRWSLRETSPELRRRWFRSDGDDVVLDESVRAAVDFEQVNLAEDHPLRWAPDTYDVVFCRNVLMYLTPGAAQGVIERLTRSLRPGGFLFLGHAENLRGLSQDFHLRHSHETFYYQRKDVPASPPVARPAPRVERRRAEPVPVPRPTPAPPAIDLRPARELLSAERFAEALELVQALPPETDEDVDVLLLRAALLTHDGSLDRAEATCRALLELDELSAGAHYLLALCRDAAGDPAAAGEHDRMAIHLDPGFAMPRLHLGLLARRTGDHPTMDRELRNAMTLLQGEDPARMLLFGGGFSRDALVELCRGALRADGRAR
jgi:chemotaxis protein methyltransferase CheR